MATPPDAGGSAGASSAWGGRFSGATADIVQAMNASVGFDQALALEDIAGSVAHSRMLAAQGLMSAAEQAEIEGGLAAIAAEIRGGRFAWSVAREDVHMNVEGALADRIGRAAGKLHTGRSRNDQVALDLRLWLRRELTELGEAVAAAVSALTGGAEAHTGTLMPGYTHLQRAQPITFGHHLMAYAAMFLRDLDRLLDARRRAAVLPLGSGALAGSPLPLDRHRVAAELELDAITWNSLDGVSDRDPALETLSALSILMVHVSRLGEELVLWTSQEFGFVELSDAFCTGSSLMPQKKNPDIPELLRGKAGRVFGALQALLVTMKGLPLAYNKDMQEDKEPLFDAMATARACVGILPDLLGAMTVREDRMKTALADGFLLATDLADYLTDKGVPFREAHHAVGHVVAHCVATRRRLEDLDADALHALDENFGPDALAVLDAARSVARRSLPGGPAPAAVEAALGQARAALAALRERLGAGGPSAIERALAAGEALPRGAGMNHFHRGPDGALWAEDVPLEQVAAEVGTPTYVYSRATIERHYRAFDAAWASVPHLVCFAVKACSNLAVLNLLARLGAGFDIVSLGELERVLRAGGSPDRVVFSGVGKTVPELERALAVGVRCVNVESPAELAMLDEVARRLGVRAPVSLRVNPDVDPKTHPYIATGLKRNKFGIPYDAALPTYEDAMGRAGIEVVGLDFHIGSQLAETGPFVEATERMVALLDELHARGVPIRHLDVGGGLGITYRAEAPPGPAEYAAAVLERIGDRAVEIVTEPGRVIVGNAGVLLTRCVLTKDNGETRFVVVDAGMNDAIRPALYSAWHDLEPVAPPRAASAVVDVVGPVCESGDFFARDRELPELAAGELVAMRSAGAYGFVMSSNYNSRPRAAEVLVDGDRYHVVRARETVEDLMRGETLPDLDAPPSA